MPTHRREPEPVAEVEWEAEESTYRTIWLVATHLHQAARAGATDKFTARMAALILLDAAYEGFLNHLIERLYPQVWAQERTFFRGPPFEGTLGKTAFLAVGVGLELQRGSRPHRTVAELHAWRNDLVHPKSLRARGRSRADAYARKPARVEPVAFTKLRPRFAEECFDDVEALADSLLLAATQKHHADTRELATLDRHAFSPVLGHSGGTLKLTKREEPCR